MGYDGFLIQQQTESIEKAMKYLKYNTEFAQPMKDLSTKNDHAKQKYTKAEKNFLTKRDKLIH